MATDDRRELLPTPAIARVVKHPRSWLVPAMFAVAMVVAIALISTFATRESLRSAQSELSRLRTESQCRNSLVTNHEIARSQLDEMLAAFLAEVVRRSELGVRSDPPTVEDLEAIKVKLEEARQRRVDADRICSQS